MNLNEEKDQSQDVEHKFLDPEIGIEIELKKDRLYKIRKTTKIVKAKHSKNINDVESPFSKLDHYSAYPKSSAPIGVFDDFEENVFLTDAFLNEIIQETQTDE